MNACNMHVIKGGGDVITCKYIQLCTHETRDGVGHCGWRVCGNRKWLEGNLSFVRVQSVYVQYKKDGLDSELSRSVEIRRGLEIRAISGSDEEMLINML